MAMCGEFAVRVKKNRGGMVDQYRNLRGTRLWKGFLFGKPNFNSDDSALLTEMLGLALATLTIFVRSVFRIAELSQGFLGPLANNEVTFMVSGYH